MELLNLQGRRVLITQSRDFMGPALARVFSALGAVVIADARALGDEPDLARQVIEEAGDVDVLIAHLALPAPRPPTARRAVPSSPGYEPSASNWRATASR